MSVPLAQAPLPLEPAAFGQSSGSVSLVQTHIGWVYLINNYAFKIKKQVKFDFLDFTTLEQRRWACEREVSLNKRLCPDLYRGILPVVEDLKGKRCVAFSNPLGEIHDYAVWMRRLPEERMLDKLLENNLVTVADVQRIAETLAEFYLRQRSEPRPSGSETALTSLRFNVDENLREGKTLDREVLAGGALKFIEHRARYFLDKYGTMIDQREREGFIIDGHGDLRAENVNLPETGAPLLFDCIEFNDRFRIIDMALDAAFLAMDFSSRDREDLAVAFIERYKQRCDPNLNPKLLNFYLGYRAFVKAKVAAWISMDKNVRDEQKTASKKQARELFDLSVRYAMRDEPALFVFCGPAGSGKSTLATELARRLKCAHIATDIVRDELVPRGEAAEKRYAGSISGRVYEILLERAAEAMRKGQTVILDGTFTTRDLRKRAAELAAQLSSKAVLIWADSSAAAIEKHLHERAKNGETFGSEASAEISRKQQGTFVPPGETELKENGGKFDAICRISTGDALEKSTRTVFNDTMNALV